MHYTILIAFHIQSLPTHIPTDPPTNDVNINDNYDDEVNPDTPTNGVNNETIEKYEDKNYEEEAE